MVRKTAAFAGGRGSDCGRRFSVGELFPFALCNSDGHRTVRKDDHGTLDDVGHLEHQSTHAFRIVPDGLSSGFVKFAPQKALAVEKRVAGGL